MLICEGGSPEVGPVENTRPRWLCFLFLLAGALLGEDAYVVPEQAEPLSFSFPAVVDLDRSKAAMLLPTCRDVVAVASVMPGAAVQIGDPVIVFSSQIPRLRAATATLSLIEAEREAKRREQELERERYALLSEKSALEQDLLVAEADLAAARAGDAERIQVLQAEVALAQAEQTAAGRALVLAEVRHGAGALEIDALRAAHRSVERAADAHALKQAELVRAQEATDALTVQRRVARVSSLRAQLGLSDEGTPNPAAGILGRIAAQEASQKREKRQANDRRDESQRDLHTQERDGWDHTPVQSIVVSGPAAVRVAFAPPEVDVPAEHQRAGAEPFAAERGWGWTSGKAVVLARTGRQPGPTLALVRGEATWSAVVPNGTYTVTVTLGDTVDWDGAVLRLAGGGEPLGIFAARRLDPRKVVTVTGTIDVTSGRLDVICGDGAGKALRAPVAGMAMPRDFIKPGWKPGWLQDPSAFVIGPEALRVRSRVHQTLANLLTLPDAPTAAAADAVTALRSALAVSTVAFVSAGGVCGQAILASVSTRPEPLSLRSDDLPRNSLDRLGNEAMFELDIADALRVRLGEAVELTATLVPPVMATVLPAHLVSLAGDLSYMQVVGSEPRAVTALRIGEYWVVAEKIVPGTRLQSPRLALEAEGPRSVPGEVIAGAAVPVMALNTGGRLSTLIEEGSEVKEGQVVATLYNPWMEERREESERQKAKARETFRNAGESRRVANERAAAAQREQAAAEQVARIDTGLARLADPVPLLRAEQSAASARQSAIDAAETLARAERQGDIDPQRLATARSAMASAELKASQAELALVNVRRSADWLSILTAEGLWRDAATEVAGRESDLRLARADEKVSALQADLRLQQAMQGNRWEQNFLKGRDIKAPAAGRLFYRNGWDDRTNRDAKFEKDFWLWRGMTLADVLDMNHLAFSAEVSEDAFAKLKAGATVELVFAQYNHRRVSATIRELGRALSTPRDVDDQADAATAVARRRLIPVIIDFTPPPDLRDRMVPGTKGALVLP